MAGTTWNVFAPNTKARSTQVNENFEWIEGALVPMNAGSKTNAVYDLGETSYRWRDLYCSRNGYFGGGDVEIKQATDGFPFHGLMIRGTGDDYLNIFETNSDYAGIQSGDEADYRDVLINPYGGNVGIGGTAPTLPSSKLHVRGTFQVLNGTSINEISTDGTLSGDSDDAVPTEKAVKTYVDTALAPAPFKAIIAGDMILTNTVEELKITWTESSDPFNEMSTSTFQAATNGTFLINFGAECELTGQSGAAFVAFCFFKNGSPVEYAPLTIVHDATISSYHHIQMGSIFSLSTSDTFEVYAQCTAAQGIRIKQYNNPGWFENSVGSTNITIPATKLEIKRF